MAYVKNWDDVKVKQNTSGSAAGQTASPTGQQGNGVAGNAPKQTAYGSTPVGVRDTMVNQYGLDNNKIGWDGTNVLYDGNVFLKPDYVDNNGISFSSGSSIYNAVANLGANGQTAVRSGLGAYGLDTNELGMTDGQVTYGGKAYLTPDRVENGVSYVDNPNDLMNMAMQVYRDNGQDIVRLTDYVANTQLPFQVNYQNGFVSVGGQMIEPAFVLDGKAYVDKNALDKAVAKAQDAAGIQNRQDIYAKYDDRYGDLYANLVDRIYNREDFSYNPETDPAYEAYRDMYLREGDRAMRDAMGAAMGATGGYMNSAAATAAAQQNNYYTQQLNDRLPELMQFAYQRYADDFTRDRQALSDIMGLDTQQFNREYGVNNDIINDIRYNNQLNEARDDKAYDRSIADREWQQYLRAYDDDQDWKQKTWDRDESRYQDDLGFRNKEENRADRQFDMGEEQYNISKILQAGQMMGAFTPEQNAILARAFGAPEGTVFDPWGLEKQAAAINYGISQQYAQPAASRSYSSSSGGRSSSGKSSSGGSSGSNSGITSSYATKAKNAVGYINDYAKKQGYSDDGLIGKDASGRYTITYAYPETAEEFIINSIRKNTDLTEDEQLALLEEILGDNLTLDKVISAGKH